MRLALLAATAVLATVPTPALAKSPSPGNVIDAIAATADEDGRVHAVLTVTSTTPLGNGLRRVDATWQGRPVSGLMEEPSAPPQWLGYRVHAEGTVVAAGGTSALIGVDEVADGTSNTMVFLASGAHFAPTTQLSYSFQDVLVESLAISSADHSLWTTPAATPFAAAVLDAPPTGAETATIDMNVTVLQTPVGPIGTMRGPQNGIIAILIGLY